MEYLRTSNIFYLINGPRYVWYLWLTYVKKEHFKLWNNIKIIRNQFTEFLKFGPGIGIILGLEKSLLRAPTWPNYFFPTFSTAIFTNNIKSKKTEPGIFATTFRSYEKNFFVFSVPCKNFELTRHFHKNLGHTIVQRLCFSACAKF